MIYVIKHSWALLLGIFLLLLGNGVQGTLLGIRGVAEGFSTGVLSLIMAAYFLGFLGGSRLTPLLIRRVGHVRVFAALASFISAALILFAALPDQFAWFALRVVVGFCYSGVYVVSESWLNDSATNETRGQSLSAYMIIQMMGIVAAQWLLSAVDTSGYTLFVIISVAVSLSFAPILLSANPAPMFQTTKPMTLKQLYHASPLGVVGSFLLGGVFGAQFGMVAVYGAAVGMSIGEIALFASAIYVGGMLLQYPIGWLSDHMDRRLLIVSASLTGGAAALAVLPFSDNFTALMITAFVLGGTTNPLYSLYIAYTNDFLEPEDMAAASGGLIFVNGVGAITGPLIVGWLMTRFAPSGFFVYLGVVLLLMGGYALYRMSQRAAPSIEDTNAYTPVTPSASPVAVEVAQEIAIEAAQDEESHD
ncbi:MAG: MFS transporter [Rhodobacteraceae bacterium]|nr:MFS transporter [Paracoccaceae bacterium]